MDLGIIIICYLLSFAILHLLIGFLIGLAIESIYNISGDKALCISFFWSFMILFMLFTLPCKKIKQFIKLKKANKIEEDKRKKELVDNVLKELNIR